MKDSSLSRTLEELSRSRYSWEELQRRPLPDGVDPAKLEKYLSEEDFEVKSIRIKFSVVLSHIFNYFNLSSLQAHLGVSRSDFESSPRWKQIEIRKEKGLF